MNENLAREEICRVGRSLFERGYAHATAGNISVRLDDGYLITPTDACLGALDPARISKVDREGTHVSGDAPSKTLRFHEHIYSTCGQLRRPTRCVIHTHSTACVALSLDESGTELLPPLTPYFVMKVGHVPLLPYHRPGDPALGPLVADEIRAWHARDVLLRAVMLRRIGPNVWHDTPAAAMATMEELEETAKLWHMQRRLASPLERHHIDELRLSFGATW